MSNYTPAETEHTHRCRELERELGREPSARVMYNPTAHLYRRWRVEQDLTFAMPGPDGQLSPDVGEKATALIAEGATAVEVLEVFHRYLHDENGHKFYHSRRKAGLPVDAEPYPLSVAELNERAKRRAWAQKAKEQAEEGFRKHAHNMMAHYGVLDMAKKYAKRTGRLSRLFGKGK